MQNQILVLATVRFKPPKHKILQRDQSLPFTTPATKNSNMKNKEMTAAKGTKKKESKTLHKSLRDQLKKAGIIAGTLPSVGQLKHLIEIVDTHYGEWDTDTAVLTKTLANITDELESVKKDSDHAKTHTRNLLDAVSGGLGYFADSENRSTESLSEAQKEFVNSFESIIGQQGSPPEEEKNIGNKFNKLTEAVISLVDKAATAKELQDQIRDAGAVQKLLVPPTGVFEQKGLTYSSTFKPCMACGGDWWSIHELDEHRTMIILGDITGHGVAAAMIAGTAKGAFDAIAHEGPRSVVESIHNMLQQPGKEDQAMTCAIGVVDRQKSTIEMTSAGHPFQLLIDSKGVASPIIATGNPLGVLDQAFATSTVRPFNVNDSIVFYSDGITECINPKGQFFGDRRFRKAIKNAKFDSADNMRASIMQEVDKHRQDAALEDDLTLVVVRRTS